MKVSYERYIACTPTKIREVFLDEDFWRAFLRQGKAQDEEVSVDPDAALVRLAWKVSLPSDVPGLVKVLVGKSVRIELRMPLQHGEEWRLDLDARAKKKGELRSNLTIDAEGEGSVLRLAGRVKVHAGLLSGQAEGPAWQEVIKPLVEEDLMPLAENWCSDDQVDTD